MGRANSTDSKRRNVCGMLVRKPEGKTKPRNEDKMKMAPR
jgi:hypothetical protein